MRSCLAIVASYVALSCCGFPQALQKVASIDLPGPTGQRFDYLAIDEEDHYLLSAHLGPGLLYVVDTKTDKVVKTIAGLPGITGLEYVPGFHKVYTSNWGEEKIGVVDLRTMSVIKRFAHRIETKWNRLRRTISKNIRREHA